MDEAEEESSLASSSSSLSKVGEGSGGGGRLNGGCPSLGPAAIVLRRSDMVRSTCREKG